MDKNPSFVYVEVSKGNNKHNVKKLMVSRNMNVGGIIL